MSADLPPGFTLDPAPAASPTQGSAGPSGASLPPGFTLDTPQGPPPNGSIPNAMLQGLIHGVPAGLEQGLSSLFRYSDRFDPFKGDAAANAADEASLDKRAQANNQALAANYQAPADAPKSVADAVSGSTGPLDAALRVAGYGGRKVAENAGTIIPNLALGAAAPESALARGGMLGYDYLQNLAGVSNAKQAAGLDPTKVSTGDMLNAGGQTALMSATPIGAGSNLVGRIAGGALDGAAKGSVQSVANDTGALLQGGQLGADPASTLLTMGSNALNAGVAGATAGGGLLAAKEGAGQVQNYLTTRKAGPNMQAYQAETAPWNAALQQATQRITQANPGMDPNEVQRQAYIAAQAGPNGNDGVAPPSFQNLSPQAQNGQAELAATQMYDQRLAAVTSGMGKGSNVPQPAPAQIFKGVLGDVVGGLQDMSKLARQAGLLDSNQAADFNGAIAEAQKHNYLAGEGGAQLGYFDTLRDKVAALPLDPVMVNQAMQMLRVADIASQASLYKNSVGPLQRNAGIILPLMSEGAGLLTGGAAGGVLGGLGSTLFKSQGTAALRKLDQVMGNGLPDILQRRAAIQQYATKNGLSAVADPMALQDMNNQLRGLASQPPSGPVPMAPQTPQGPVTASGQGYTGQPTPGPVAPSQAPQMAPSGPPPTAPAPAPSAAPAQPSVAPVTAADRLAAAPVRVPPQVQAGASSTPAPATLAQAMQATQAALAAHNAGLAQSAQTAFPSTRRGWSAAMANQLGVQHDPMLAAIQHNVAGSPDLEQAIQGHTIPLDMMRAITNHMADLRDAGKLPLANQAQPNPAAAQYGPVKNPLSYMANLVQERATANGIKAAYPHLAPVVDAMRDPVQNGKTAKGRGKVLDTYLAGLSPTQQATEEAILRPLTGYGQK